MRLWGGVQCASVWRVSRGSPRLGRARSFTWLGLSPRCVPPAGRSGNILNANRPRQPPNRQIYTAMIDEHVDERGYIVPGLGDAGDRAYGTPHH